MIDGLLVGSRAALIHDCLPPWREGRVIDWDIHARPAVIDRWAEGRGLSRRGRNFLGPADLRVSFFEWDEVSDALLACPGSRHVDALGLSLLAVAPMALLALKCGYRKAAFRHSQKTRRDVEYWIARGDPQSWRPEHEAVYRSMARRAAITFNHPDPGQPPWPLP